MAGGIIGLVTTVVEETVAAVPRAVDRTQAQIEIARRVLAVLPCAACHDRATDGADPDGGSTAAVIPIREAAGGTRGTPDGPSAEAEQGVPLPAEEAPALDAPDVGSLAIPDYDSLAASQVVPRLASLDGAELSDVGAYEQAHRGRRTILNRVRQLQGDGRAG